MTRAEVTAPMRMAYCMALGVPPTRKPVLSDCAVVPPLEAATHTTPAIDSASTRSIDDVQPKARKIRQVRVRVATVMPEIGFDDEPISPVSRADTVTNRKPKTTTRMA